MKIERVWAMPSKWTFDVVQIKSLVRKYAGDGTGWADPFAGQSSFAEYRNDLNPENSQPHCMEASDFLARFDNHSLWGVIFDPPYSITQVKISYETMNYKFNGKENPTGGFPLVRDHIRRVVRPEGHVISFGWNTAGVGTGRDFDIKEILIVAHGGNRNDTLCTVEQKSPQLELSLAESQ